MRINRVFYVKPPKLDDVWLLIAKYRAISGNPGVKNTAPIEPNEINIIKIIIFFIRASMINCHIGSNILKTDSKINHFLRWVTTGL
jgi:hypothetical protein